jgi:hypothetical protein
VKATALMLQVLLAWLSGCAPSKEKCAVKRFALILLVLAALLSGCTAPPVFRAPTAPAVRATAEPTAALSPQATALPSPEPVASAPASEATATRTTPSTAEARSSSTPGARAVTPAATATAAPVAVATVARLTAAPIAAATPEQSGLGSTEVIAPAGAIATTYRVAEISLPTYPYSPFLAATTDPALDYPAFAFDGQAYEASGPRPAPKTYKLLMLENPYLRVGILPELGGRVYECVFKPTGANEFYANPVIKPTQWGPAAPPNAPGANWWLGAGGLEWSFPVEEHGYEFGTAWGYDHASLPDGGVMITVYTQTGPEKPYAVVDIILPPDTAYFVVQPRLVNPLGAPWRFKWWSNAMLAPGRPNTVSPDLRFVVPATEMTVHSTGDASLPQAGQALSWPVANGRDLSRLGNWQNYLGAFSRPAAGGGFAAVYDPRLDEGMIRVYPAGVTKGLKIFAPRGANGLDPALWTDDGSTYVELHVGLEPTFAEWHELGPGEDVTWSEFWYPVAGIGGLTHANDRAALSLVPAGGKLRAGLFPTTPVTGRATITLEGASPVTLDVQMSPAQPFLADLVLPDGVSAAGQAAVTLVDAAGATVYEWSGRVPLR